MWDNSCLLLAVRRFFIDKEGIYLVYYNEMWFLSAFGRQKSSQWNCFGGKGRPIWFFLYMCFGP
jgi:hypothetical protein